MAKSPAALLSEKWSIMDEVFGLRIKEHVKCAKCGKISFQLEEHVEHHILLSPAAVRLFLVSGKPDP